MAKINVKTALSERKYPHPIPSRHITTLAVNDTRLTNIVNVRKGERISCEYSQFTRLMPLVAPTYGSFKISTYSFFVPIRTIWAHYKEYRQENVDRSAGAIDPINFSFNMIMDIILGVVEEPYPTPGNWGSDYISEVYTFPDVSNLGSVRYDGYDLAVVDVSNTQLMHVYGIRLSQKGRQLWTLLHTLGYTFPTVIPVTSDENSHYRTWFTSEEYSLFPLLAVARVYYDYLYPSNYVNLGNFMYLFTSTLWESWQTDPYVCMDDILELLFNKYDESFWTSLWQLPNQVVRGATANQSVVVNNAVDGVSDNLKLESQLLNHSSRFATSANMGQDNGSVQGTTLSASALRWLEALSDYAIRNQIGGQRFRDWARAHFGYVSSDERDESTFLKVFTDEVVIQDVTNVSASSDSSPLGLQGGKGISGGQNRLNFEASEDGFLLFITQVRPLVGYYQGIKPWCRKITSPRQFYTPEFDGVGMEAVPRSSVFSLYQEGADYNKVAIQSRNDVFGYAPMYTERYKVGHDFLSGDFILKSRGSEMLKSYHTFRDVLYGRSNLANDLAFQQMDNQTQRIFAYVGDETSQGVDQDDKMLSFFSFDMVRYSPIKPLSQSIPLFDKSGRDVVMDYLGK